MDQFQQNLFKEYISEYLNPIKLKEGKIKCPLCSRPMKAYGYALDKKLVKLAFDIYGWCMSNHRKTFCPRQIWGDELRANTQFQKLKCHGIIRRTKHTGWWEITRKGYSFLTGTIQLPRKVWSFNGQTVLEDDTYVHVGNVEEDYKLFSCDWVYDYVIQKYQTEINLKELRI